MPAGSIQIGSEVLLVLACDWTEESRFVQGKARSKTGLQKSDE